MIRYYSFHDIANISIESKKMGYLLGKVLDRYKLYSVNEPSSADADIRVHLAALRQERKHEKREGEISGVFKHSIAVIKYHILISEKQADAFLYHNYMAIPFVHSIILPLLHLMAFNKGYLPLHSAGLCKDGKVVIILGPTGIGKSRTHLEMLAQGFTSMGDDWLWVDKEMNAFSFLTPIIISRKKKNLHILRPYEKPKVYLLGTIKILTLGHINIPLRRIWKNHNYTKLSAKLTDIFAIKNHINKKDKATLSKYLDEEYLEDLLSELSFADDALGEKIIDRQSLRLRYRNLFENFRKHCNCHLLTVNLPYKSGEYEKILEYILTNITR